MKIQIIILSTLILLLCSCRKELEYPPQDETGHVTFMVESISRNSQEGDFQDGDAIGIFAIEPITGVYWAKIINMSMMAINSSQRLKRTI